MLEVDEIFQSPDEILARQNINAIAVYVQNGRKDLRAHPSALDPIEKFEAWFGKLEVSTHDWFPHIVNAEDVGEAKRQRSAVNRELARKLPPDRVPADGPQTPPDAPDPLIPPLGLTGTIVGAVAIAVAAAYVVSSMRRTA